MSRASRSEDARARSFYRQEGRNGLTEKWHCSPDWLIASARHNDLRLSTIYASPCRITGDPSDPRLFHALKTRVIVGAEGGLEFFAGN